MNISQDPMRLTALQCFFFFLVITSLQIWVKLKSQNQWGFTLAETQYISLPARTQPVFWYLHSFFFFYLSFFCFSFSFIVIFTVGKSASVLCASFYWSSLPWDFRLKHACVETSEKGQLPDDLILRKGNFKHPIQKKKKVGKKTNWKRDGKNCFLSDQKLLYLPVHLL